MNAYMVYAGDPADGAALVFARTVHEGRKVGAKTIMDLSWCDYTDVRATKLQAPHLFAEADPEKLRAGEPHVVDAPKCCPTCETWGYPLTNDGLACEGCREDDEAE